MSNRIITIEQIGYKIDDTSTAVTVDCIGKLEYTIDSTQKTKPCGSATEVVAVINNGTGKVNIDAHTDNDSYEEMLGMTDATNKMAVNKRGSRRPNVVLTAYGEDEDGKEVVLAWPKAMITADETTVSTDNSSNEIAYLSQEFSYNPDANKIGLYIKNVDDLPTGITREQWMSSFDAKTMAKA